MDPTGLALLIGALIVAGGFGAYRFSRWAKANIGAKAALMASVSAWTALTGLIPFLIFGLLAVRTNGDPIGATEKVLFNLLPITVLLSPVAGFIQGLAAYRSEVES